MFIYTLTFSCATLFREVSLLLHVPVHTLVFFYVMRILFLAALSPKVNLISHYKISNILIFFIHPSSLGDLTWPPLTRRNSYFFSSFLSSVRCSEFDFLYYLETKSPNVTNKNFDYPSLVYLIICVLKRVFNFHRWIWPSNMGFSIGHLFSLFSLPSFHFHTNS